jgi:NADPH-dependent 2,4-dienoyl-CoA reductase/sulfur reductase-like enzyme
MHPCGLPYALEGIVNSVDLLQNINLEGGGITRYKGKVNNISTDTKEVFFQTENGDHVNEKYDSLILTTGNKAIIPPINDINELLDKSIFTLTGISDLNRIRTAVKKASNCLVIGGGAIGIETAYALNKSGKRVTIVEMREHLLQGILDADISLLIENYLKSEGIILHKSTTVTSFEPKEKMHNVICDSDNIESELTILASGFAPDTAIAEKSGIEFNKSGIKTNTFLKTTADSVFAAGDCISAWSSIDGKPITSRLATSAYKQGTVAGINSLGGNTEYRGTASTFATRIGSFEVAGTGFNTETAINRGFEPLSGKIKSKIRPEYYPDNADITIKIIFDKNSG